MLQSPHAKFSPMPEIASYIFTHRSIAALSGEGPRLLITKLITLILLVAFPLLALDSAQAQKRLSTLGGPVVNAETGEITDPNGGAASNARVRPVNDSDGKAPRLGGGERSTGEGKHDATSVAPISPLPVDAGAIRRLKVGGKVTEDAPMRVGNLDVLAPLVPELSILGAWATQAAPDNVPGNPQAPTDDQVFQINLPQGPPIVLVIGKPVAYINHTEQTLRAAPLVIREKIWLPIFSLAPLLGAAVRLEDDGTLHLNPTVQSIELFTIKGMLALTIKTSAPLRPGGVLMGTIDDPPKLYFDFPGYSMGLDAANSINERVVSNGLGDVQRVRVGLFQKFVDTTRVVLDLKKEMTGVTQPIPDKTLAAFFVVEPGKRFSPASPPPVPLPRNGSLRGFKIVVDAGHGGHDLGAPGAQSREKDHTLSIARRLRDILMQRGATVYMTRDADYFVPLQDRVSFANQRKADIFFSVHINSFRPTSIGTETFYWTAHSQMLAREVQNELVKATGLKSRGISQARFFVVRKTWMPSVLTETCFISNPKEEALLVNPQWRERVAQGMAQGITNYYHRFVQPAGMAG